ncbi:LemA family protein [bacterium]|nr:LemA family protein [bacterium]
MVGLVSLAVVVILAIMILSWLISGYNKGIQLKNYVTEAFSTMDVYMKKRWDLVPNLLETTKGYAEHEKGVFEEITKLRNQNYTGLSDDQKIDVNNQMTAALSKLVAVAESYPDLKADANFRQFSDELSGIEKEIANARKYYNGCVREYTNFLELFPTNLIATIFHFAKYKLFEIDEKERENVQVKF